MSTPLTHAEKPSERNPAKQGEMKNCIRCGHKLPACKFWIQTNGRPINVCKNCYRERNKSWRDKNPEKAKSYSAKWNRAHPDHSHKHKLMYRYGMTLEEFNTKLVTQGNVCAICEKPESRGQHLSVDHCHASGKNRGLLCDGCNRALGSFRDSIDTLNRAVAYLNRYI